MWFTSNKQKELEQFASDQANTIRSQAEIISLLRTVVQQDTGSVTRVTPATALGHSAFLAGTNIIAEDIAGLSWHTLKRDGRSRIKAYEHPNYSLLHDNPNPYMSAFDWRYQTILKLVLRGEAFHFLEMENARVTAIWPLRNDNVEVHIDDGELYYKVKVRGHWQIVSPARILHIKGMTHDGIRGVSVLTHAAGVLGVAIATDHLAAKYYSNGTIISGYLSHPGSPSPTAKQHLKETWKGVGGDGLDGAFGTPLLPEGMTYTPLQIRAEEAQLIESRKWGVEEVLRLLRVSPPIAGHLERSTFNNIEELMIAHVRQTLRPWAIRLEQEVQRKMFWEEDKNLYYNKLDFNSLERGSIKTRYETYAIGRQWGILSINDCRENEDMPTIADGDDYLSPLNMAPAEEQSEDNFEEPQITKVVIEPDLTPLINHARRQLLRKEINAVKRAKKKFSTPEAFTDWAETFYVKHEQLAEEVFAPIEQIKPQAIDMVSEHIETSMRDLKLAVQGEDLAQELSAVIENWEAKCNDLM